MPNIIDTQQLQATAQVAKSFILEQDTANVTTIINALQQGGGSAPAGKQEGIITINGSRNPVFSAPGSYSVTYNGDAPFLYLVSDNGSGSFNQTTMTLTIPKDTTGHIFAYYTDNFTAASASFGYVDD